MKKSLAVIFLTVLAVVLWCSLKGVENAYISEGNPDKNWPYEMSREHFPGYDIVGIQSQVNKSMVTRKGLYRNCSYLLTWKTTNTDSIWMEGDTVYHKEYTKVGEGLTWELYFFPAMHEASIVTDNHDHAGDSIYFSTVPHTMKNPHGHWDIDPLYRYLTR